MKKKNLLITLLILVSLPIRSESSFRDSLYALSANIQYEYNHTYLHSASLQMDAFLPLTHYFEGEVNLRASLNNTYNFGIKMQPKFALPVGELYLRTQLSYGLILRNRFHELCTVIGIGYRMDYMDVMVAYGSRLMATMDMDKNSIEHGINEPHNLIYRAEVYARPQYSPWNISVWVSNLTSHQMERMFTPMFGLRSHIDIVPSWRLQLGGMIKPVGLSNLAPSFYGAEVNVGVQYRFSRKEKKS